MRVVNYSKKRSTLRRSCYGVAGGRRALLWKVFHRVFEAK